MNSLLVYCKLIKILRDNLTQSGWEIPLSDDLADLAAQFLENDQENEEEDILSSDIPMSDDFPSDSGRKFIETRLRQDIIIDTWPDQIAGRPINDFQAQDFGYQNYQQSVHGQNQNIYAPFKSHLDWEIARWAKLRGPSSTALTELLSIQGIQEALGLSYKNSRELNKIVDSQLPTVRPRFTRKEIILGDVSHILYYRDVLTCIQALFGAPEFAQYLVFVPERHYTDNDRNNRLYHDMHTGKWWCQTQELIEKEKPGATIIPIILSSDKTQITQFEGKSAYPVYMTIGNLPKEICKKPSWNGQILLAYLPIANLEHVANQAGKRRMTTNLFHACMRIILEPLEQSGLDGISMTSGDGVTRRCHPSVAAYCCDYMEQIVVTGCKMGECPMGDIAKEDLGNFDAECTPRNLAQVQEALDTYDTNPDDFISACKEAGIKPIVRPFWLRLPYYNIFRIITPDILHQLYHGLIKHLVTWIKAAYSLAELDARCRRLPPNHHVRHFLKGITCLSHLTGKEHNDIARILLGLIIDIPLPDGRSSALLVQAVRAMLDFIYLAQYPVHSTETLNLLKEALSRFHQTKHIFEELEIRDSWEIPKLHYAMHYVLLIKWLGTLDNFDTQYTERLHIDFAKDAYEATNHKDEFAQMTIWLECKEKIIKHELFIKWRKTGKPIEDLIHKTLTYPTHHIQMTKHPTHKHVLFEEIIQEYHAPFIKDALARYIVHFHNPDLSWRQVERKAMDYILPLNGLAIYHCIKLWLGDMQSYRLSSDETDVIHAQPARQDRYGKPVAARFDIALITDEEGENIGIQGKNLSDEPSN